MFLYLLFGADAVKHEKRYFDVLKSIGNACGNIPLKLVGTPRLERAMHAIGDTDLEVVDLTNDVGMGMYDYSNCCEALAIAIHQSGQRPMVNIEDPELRCLSVIFRRNGIVPTELGPEHAVKRRWDFLRSRAPTNC